MSEPEKPKNIKFHYIKSNFFRTVRCDGVIGALTPRLDIILNVFSERQPIPKSISYELKEDGTLGLEVGRSARRGIVREVEISISMNLQAAQTLRDWLSDRLNESEDLKKKYESVLATRDEPEQTN